MTEGASQSALSTRYLYSLYLFVPEPEGKVAVFSGYSHAGYITTLALSAVPAFLTERMATDEREYEARKQKEGEIRIPYSDDLLAELGL